MLCTSCNNLMTYLENRPNALSVRWNCGKCGARRYTKTATPGTTEKFTEWFESKKIVKWWRASWFAKNWPVVLIFCTICGFIFRNTLLGIALYMSDGKLPTPPAPVEHPSTAK